MLCTLGIVIEFFALSEEQGKVVGEKILELGNIGAGALAFGSALAEGRIRWIYIVSGALFGFITFGVYLFVTKLTKPQGERND
jgi:hypothetical protein